MKKFRSSFNHLVREKLIAGVSDTTPTPETRDLSKLYPGLIANHTGRFEYQVHDLTTVYAGNTWITQGSMGYGMPPIGDGTAPYRCFMSNKQDNNMVPGSYTGGTDAPSITFKDLHHTGVGTTFATGVATQYVIVSTGNRHGYVPGTIHTLATIYGVRAESGAYVAQNNTDDNNGKLEFCYRIGADNSKSFDLFVNVVDTNGTKGLQLLTSGLHFYTAYGRLLPVSVVLNSDGTFEFRVDSKTITGDITTLVNTAGDSLSMPFSGKLQLKLSGMLSSPFSSPYSGMGNPISRITNVAVNDNDDTDGQGDVGLPPFITGVPCTPIRDSVDDWDLPLQVVDPDSGWIPFSESSPTVEYGLSAVADNQLFDTRGVAASGYDKPLHVYTANTSTLNADLSALGLTGLSAVESINTMVYDSAVLSDTKILTFKITETGTYQPITMSKTFDGIQNDFADSALTFFYTDTGADMTIDTFNNGMVFSLTVDETAPTPTPTSTPTPTATATPTPTPTATPTPTPTQVVNYTYQQAVQDTSVQYFTYQGTNNLGQTRTVNLQWSTLWSIVSKLGWNNISTPWLQSNPLYVRLRNSDDTYECFRPMTMINDTWTDGHDGYTHANDNIYYTSEADCVNSTPASNT